VTPAYLDCVASDATALAEAARLGLDAPVPSCPEWTVLDLVHHTGMVHRWVVEIVRRQARERIPRNELPPPPSSSDDVLPWFEDGATTLVALLDAADPAMPVWNWSTTRPHTAAFWPRRMAHETAVHRFDAQLAHDRTAPVEAALAVDGVDELVDTVLPTLVSDKPDASLGGSLHVHCSDVEGEWSIELQNGTVEVRHEHGKGDAAVRGAASDLLLFLWGRLPLDAVETFGDASVLANWAELSRL
jgi:uncharacterized protein (TIGR03083 family)